jgi:hypothetical protein
MGKYERARAAIEVAVEGGAADGFDRADLLLALLVSVIEDLNKTVGPKSTREALTYELDNTAGKVDTVFLRSR